MIGPSDSRRSFHRAAFDALARRIRDDGVAVTVEPMDPETPARFDGPSITINEGQGDAERCYYLAHSFGSIAAWSLDFERVHHMFETLRAAKQSRDAARLDDAIEAFARFEEVASEYAVWLLEATLLRRLVEAYTEFFRADLDAMRIFHRTGKAPTWDEFFAGWRERARRGDVTIAPYTPRPIPPFRPVRIPEQEVVLEDD
jgi:hypothetical protein